MKRLLIIASLLAALAPAASAHHSGAMYDTNRSLTITGTVTRFAYFNPHTWIDVQTTSAGGEQHVVAIEGGAPASMRRAGITPSVLRVNDRVTIVYSPLRDGRRGGSLRSITLANGRTIEAATYRSNGIAPPTPGATRPRL